MAGPLVFDLERAGSPEFQAALEAGWERALERGKVLYDPRASERFESGDYRFHFFPKRASRPGAQRPRGEGIAARHVPCPFDGEEFLAEREILRLERAGRVYHVAANRYPVTAPHFIGVRSARSEELSQFVQSSAEIEDMFLAARALGDPYRVHFNSNPGADGSQSGSSVNHWHFQALAYPRGLSPGIARYEHRLSGARDGIRTGAVSLWPARAFVVEAEPGALQQAAEVLWERIRLLNERNSAYNLEVRCAEQGGFRALLFARHPAPDLEIPGSGKLSANFGGWELSGDIVIPERRIFEWIRAHPEEAVECMRRRLRQSTRDVECPSH